MFERLEIGMHVSMQLLNDADKEIANEIAG
jgi:hypothetical protein